MSKEDRAGGGVEDLPQVPQLQMGTSTPGHLHHHPRSAHQGHRPKPAGFISTFLSCGYGGTTRPVWKSGFVVEAGRWWRRGGGVGEGRYRFPSVVSEK